MFDFSLTTPTRCRPDLLWSFLESIRKTTARPEKVEVSVTYDFDDEYTRQRLRVWRREFRDINLSTYGRERNNEDFNLHRDYVNWVVPFTKGRYLFCLNDDVEIRTDGWDETARERLDTYLSDKPDGIAYGWVADDEGKCGLLKRERDGHRASCFPILSRQAVETLGFCIFPQVRAWSGDIFIFALYELIDRVVDLSDIVAQHVSYHNNLRERDWVSRQFQHVSGRFEDSEVADMMADAVSKLVLRIKQSGGEVT